jgi:hypothetical protein
MDESLTNVAKPVSARLSIKHADRFSRNYNADDRTLPAAQAHGSIAAAPGKLKPGPVSLALF